MILNRIGTAIKRQDWFVVFVELMIVVVGIYIGLQVDDWQKEREDRVDEAEFVVNLHDDLLLAEVMASRVLERRLNLINDLATASEVIFGNIERDHLTATECTAIGDARYFSINVSELPAVSELVTTGRLEILKDQEMRRAILNFQQQGERLREFISGININRPDLPEKYVDMIQATPAFFEDINEFNQIYTCNLAAMQSSQSFKNDFADTIDGYDAYLKDGLAPWAEQLGKVHDMVDAKLGIRHEGDSE